MQKELKALKSRLLKVLYHILTGFYWLRSTLEIISHANFSSLDLNLRSHDLHWTQKKYKIPETPELILSSDDATIISYNFSNQLRAKCDDIITNANHVLGFRKPEEIYKKL